MTPPRAESITQSTSAKITEATITIAVLLLNSSQEGQDTLFTNSSVVSFQISTILLINFYVARVERLELPTNGFGDHYSTN
jgi:hypothetical protein